MWAWATILGWESLGPGPDPRPAPPLPSAAQAAGRCLNDFRRTPGKPGPPPPSALSVIGRGESGIGPGRSVVGHVKLRRLLRRIARAARNPPTPNLSAPTAAGTPPDGTRHADHPAGAAPKPPYPQPFHLNMSGRAARRHGRTRSAPIIPSPLPSRPLRRRGGRRPAPDAAPAFPLGRPRRRRRRKCAARLRAGAALLHPARSGPVAIVSRACRPRSRGPAGDAPGRSWAGSRGTWRRLGLLAADTRREPGPHRSVSIA